MTGIHLSSYGLDLEGESLLSLIQAVNQIEGIRRIRLGSLEPRIVTRNLPGRLPEWRNSAPISIFPCRAAATRSCAG